MPDYPWKTNSGDQSIELELEISCLDDIWKPWSNWSACVGGCMGGGVRKRERNCEDERACANRSIKDEEECTFDMCGEEWLTATSTTTTTTTTTMTTTTMTTTSNTKQYKIKTPEPTTTTTPADIADTAATTVNTSQATNAPTSTTTTTTTTKTTTTETVGTDSNSGAQMYCGDMNINDFFTFDVKVTIIECIDNYCHLQCENKATVSILDYTRLY